MSSTKLRKISLSVMALFYIAAGTNHFLNSSFYLKIMPLWAPGPRALVIISGGLEILFGFLLLYKPARRLAALGIIVLLIAVFPANLQMFQNYKHDHNPNLWITIIRLPLQLILIGWAYSFTKPEKSKTKA